jgi:hypothetical protein
LNIFGYAGFRQCRSNLCSGVFPPLHMQVA